MNGLYEDAKPLLTGTLLFLLWLVNKIRYTIQGGILDLVLGFPPPVYCCGFAGKLTFSVYTIEAKVRKHY